MMHQVGKSRESGDLDEEQMSLLIEHDSKFSSKVPIILGMLTLPRVMRCMKESEIKNAH